MDNFLSDDWDSVEVCYTTVCKCYGTDKKDYELGSEFGCVLSSMLGIEKNFFNYDMDNPAICRAVGDDWEQIWCTNDYGDYNYDCDIDFDVNILIEYHNNPKSVAERIEFLEQQKKEIISCNFEMVIPCKFNEVKDFSNGLRRVKIKRKYGYINEQGEEVIPCQFNEVWNFSNGLAIVKIKGKYGYINEKGEVVIPCQFNEVWNFSNGLACVEIDGKWGHINEQGEVVIPCQFDDAYNFSSNGLAWVIIDGKYGLIRYKK